LRPVAVVDRAGDEASFTSYGKVDIWAHGVGVPTRTRVPPSRASLGLTSALTLLREKLGAVGLV
jgi:hypothetical protein